MGIFRIGDTDFGIGEVALEIESGGIISDLTITGNEEVYEQITVDEDRIWSWTLYPPQIYFREVPLNGNSIETTDELLEEYDISLYFMEHYNLCGTLTINDKCITVKGEADICGNIYPLEIVAENAK